MKYRKVFESLKPISYFNMVNYYFPLVETKTLSLLKFKIKNILHNSHSNNTLLERLFGKHYSFEQISASFFNTHIFAYANLEKKEKLLAFLNKRCINEVNRYLEIANQVVKKEFTVFEKKVQFKEDIDWFYGFDEEYQWIFKQSEKIDIRPRYKDHNVDVKYVWELNRHQFLPYLGFAYYITGDEKYSKTFMEIISDWIRKNPPLWGINWVSGLEISIRLISWIFALYFFRDSKLINNEQFFLKIVNVMAQHAYFLRHFYTKRSFNHTVGDMFGAYLFSKIFETYPIFERWEKRFSTLLKKQIILQVRPDGVNIEQSINYHKFVLEFFSLFLKANAKLINDEEGKIVKNMLMYLLFIIKPNNRFPLIGDNDDGKVLLLTMKEKQKYFDLLHFGASLLEINELKFISKTPSPVNILLLGIPGKFDQVNAQESKPKNRYYEDTGYIIARSSWDEDANYIFIDFGKFGPQNAPHSHSDITNIIYSYKGKEILVDSGVFTYNRSWEERNSFRNSQAHNVVVIDGQSQALATNWFGWKAKPRIKKQLFRKDTGIHARCIHDGYKGFFVERSLTIKENVDEIIIIDKIKKNNDLSLKESHSIDLYFHFAKDLELQLTQNSLEIDGELILTIESSQHFTVALEKSYNAPKYGQKYENYRLKVHFEYDFHQNDTIQIQSRLYPKKS